MIGSPAMGLRVALLASILAALAAAPARAADVDVMSFNIWLGGDVVDFGKVTEAIEASGADVVGLQEAEGNTRKVARALGWPYWSDRLHVVSRYPLIDPPEARGEYVLVQLRPGEVFALANVHLTSDPYGPYALRDGRSVNRVLALERRVRLPEIRATLRRMPGGIPTLMTGDFNTPSHLDWPTVPWPVTEALARAGFQDTYRAAHPDAAAMPGITWTFGYPFPRLNANEVVDRIDMIHASAGITTLASGIAGPPGTPDVTYPIDPYPSDHRAVISTVRLAPVAPRPFASVLHRRIERGDDVGVRYASPRGEGRDHLAIARAGERDPIMTLPPQEASFFGHVTFGSGGLTPGRYEAQLVSRRRIRSRSTFWVVAQDARPRIRARGTKISWRNTPGYRRDWIGIWKAGDTDLYNDYLTFEYTGAAVNGSTTISGLEPGRYVARLMKDDGYAELARTRFRVRR